MSAPFTYWQDQKDGKWLGYWNEYPDYPTEGYSFDDLKAMLLEVRALIDDGTLSSSERKEVGSLEFA